MFIATLVAADGLDRRTVLDVFSDLSAVNCQPSGWSWLDDGSAADIRFANDLEQARATLGDPSYRVDVVVQPAEGREKKLLVADMDSTMITIECIDELADYAGIKAEVSAVTEAAMRGELDFEGALDARVALLRGMDEGVLARCHAERVRIMPGAIKLVRTMRSRGGRAVLVSGGFTVFANRVAAEIGFDRALSNELGIAGGRLTGTVAGPIVGAATKRETLLAEAAALGIPLSATLAVGDGANDIPMIQAAGLGVAYHAKPKTAAAAAARIEHGDLTTLLYAQGIPRAAWFTA